MQKLKEAQVQNTELKRSLKEYQELDPDELEKLKAESQVSLSCVNSFFSIVLYQLLSQVSLEAVNRWTDNIFAVKSWCKSKFYMEDNQLNKAFGIPEELDYL